MKAFLNKASVKLQRWGIGLFRFLTSGIFLKNFAGIVATVALLLFLTFWWMKCYTKHGESLQVHNYIGMDLDDAVKKAKKKSFNIVVSDSIYLPDKASNTVLNQNPQPLSRVKENRKIYLTVTKSEPDLVPIPDLLGGNDDYKTYSRKLERLRVKSKINSRRFSNKLEANTILEVIYQGDTITEQLEDGLKVKMGSTVEFIVTEKSGGTVTLPNLLCQKYDAAQFLIGNYNLNIGSVIPDATVTNEENAYIWKQVPAFYVGKQIGIGQQIDLYLTQNRPDQCGAGNPNHGHIESGVGLPNEEESKPKPTTKPILKPTVEEADIEEEDEEF